MRAFIGVKGYRVYLLIIALVFTVVGTDDDFCRGDISDTVDVFGSKISWARISS